MDDHVTRRHKDQTISIRLDYLDLSAILTAARLWRYQETYQKWSQTVGHDSDIARDWHYHQEDLIDDLANELRGIDKEKRAKGLEFHKMVRQTLEEVKKQ